MARPIDYSKKAHRVTFFSAILGLTSMASGVSGPTSFLVEAAKDIAGNNIAADLHRSLAQQLSAGEDLLANHDLRAAVVAAIVAVLESEVEAREQKGLASRADALTRIAKAFPRQWGRLLDAPGLARFGRTDLDGVRESALAKLFVAAPEDVASQIALDYEAWDQILFFVAKRANCTTKDLPTYDRRKVAARLEGTFAKALFEVLKDDFGKQGHAYAGLHLMMLGTLLRSVEDLVSSGERRSTIAISALGRLNDATRQLGEKILEGLEAQKKEHWGDWIDAKITTPIIKQLHELRDVVVARLPDQSSSKSEPSKYRYSGDGPVEFEKSFLRILASAAYKREPFLIMTSYPPFFSRSPAIQRARHFRKHELRLTDQEVLRWLLRRYGLFDRTLARSEVRVIVSRRTHEEYFSRAFSAANDLALEASEQLARYIHVIGKRESLYLGVLDDDVPETFFWGPVGTLTYLNREPTLDPPASKAKGLLHTSLEANQEYREDFEETWSRLPVASKRQRDVLAWLNSLGE